ncbi:MAG: flagellar biosynthesis protein FlhA [candidate division Zixibacteria bacterium]|nr:flagellar biosynthesis protein FlhA [candidate division Zixibacteria bacterium]
MPEQKATLLEKIADHSDIAMAILVVAVIAVLVLPIPASFLDFALAFNIAFSIVILISTLYITSPLDLSVFPGMLLIITLIRLSLNVASTRLILGEGYAGDVINSFGNFVVKGNYVVGFIIFLILVIIQFVVITKGATRISEVAARFTLDAMPGKQMAIDADLNAGLISDADARTRRSEISKEADFYGAMDGASKFVRGDAIAGILITVINVIGGFIVGILMRDMTALQALKTYTLLSVGDGLVTQIPALIVSTASGIIVTRSAADNNMGKDLTKQLGMQPRAIMVASGVIFMLGVVPGMPTVPFVALGTILGAVAFIIEKSKKQKEEEDRKEEESTEEGTSEERTEDLLKVDTLEVEIGYGLIPMVDTNQNGDLLERISVIRRQQAIDMGIIVPAIRIRDNVQLQPNEYAIKIKGLIAAKAELMPDHLMAINPGYIEDDIEGFDAVEPAFNLKARWIIPNLKETAEAKGYTVVEPTAVLSTHLTEIIRANASEIISRQDIRHLLDTLKEDHPALVEGVVPEMLTLPMVHKILQMLLSERIPIRDLATIMETVSDFGATIKDPEVLSEYCRISLRRRISDMLKDENNKIYCFTLSPQVEQMLAGSIQNTKQGIMLVMAPEVTDRLVSETVRQADTLSAAGHHTICLTSPNVRLAFRRLMEVSLPQLSVISYNEVHRDIELVSSGMVEMPNDS